MFTLQHLGYPTAGRIEEHMWKDLSKHRLASVAFKKIDKLTAHLQHGTWDDHYRVIDADGNTVYENEVF